jgi:Ca2+-binding EF-hand superfamily protein
MINLSQFITGINSLVAVASTLLEKLFLKMDVNQIGMIDEPKLTGLLTVMVKSQIPTPPKVEDSFAWQEEIIQKIKDFVTASKMNSDEAFKSFDHDFDGLISMDDMKTSLTKLIKIRAEELNEPRMDRLFKLLSFYKTETIQPSDFARLIKDENPYLTASTKATKSTLMSSMGGAFNTTSTCEWKFASI